MIKSHDQIFCSIKAFLWNSIMAAIQNRINFLNQQIKAIYARFNVAQPQLVRLSEAETLRMCRMECEVREP